MVAQREGGQQPGELHPGKLHALASSGPEKAPPARQAGEGGGRGVASWGVLGPFGSTALETRWGDSGLGAGGEGRRPAWPATLPCLNAVRRVAWSLP